MLSRSLRQILMPHLCSHSNHAQLTLHLICPEDGLDHCWCPILEKFVGCVTYGKYNPLSWFLRREWPDYWIFLLNSTPFCCTVAISPKLQLQNHYLCLDLEDKFLGSFCFFDLTLNRSPNSSSFPHLVYLRTPKNWCHWFSGVASHMGHNWWNLASFDCSLHLVGKQPLAILQIRILTLLGILRDQVAFNSHVWRIHERLHHVIICRFQSKFHLC